jgi:outer membrane immunogenic protein
MPQKESGRMDDRGDSGLIKLAFRLLPQLRFTGRFGYAFDRSLLYLKGGVAGAEFKDDLSLASGAIALASGTQSNTSVGWTVGAGWEYAFLNNWTAKVEYDYLDFGSKDEDFVFSSFGSSATFHESIERKLQLVKLGVNYKF